MIDRGAPIALVVNYYRMVVWIAERVVWNGDWTDILGLWWPWADPVVFRTVGQKLNSATRDCIPVLKSNIGG